MNFRRRFLAGLACTAVLQLLRAPHAWADSGTRPPRFEGESNQFVFYRPQRAAPLTPLMDASANRVLNLSKLRGKVLLVNFWATWCAPCAREMPSLDQLAGEMVGEDFLVLPVSIDEGGTGIVAQFYRRLGLENLPIILDPYGSAYQAFGGEGLPMTYVIDREGWAMGYLTGAAEWRSMEAKALLRYYIDAPHR